MPRKKKKVYASGKPSLDFTEAPLDGTRHVYESPVLPALNPRHVNNVLVPHDTGVSWVSPQFDSAVQLKYPTRRRGGQRGISVLYGKDKRNLSCQNSLSLKRSKIPALTFKESTKLSRVRSTAAPLGCLRSSKTGLHSSSSEEDSPMRPNCCMLDNLAHPGCVNQTAHCNGSVNICKNQGCSSPRMNEIVESLDSTFTPPCVNTPDMATCVPSGDRRDVTVKKLDTIACQKSPLVTFFRDICPPSCIPEGVPAPVVLVYDTPEHEYGLRMSWRRKQNLSNYLENQRHLANTALPVTK
ncbi:RAD9, HUS1, RAD1-interacting nuclear orphan protein 1 [Protopterus annectens]|uniref:RAD9, HUS1, RAD1-interacting nuclear orphan protein 1 n=1 Tax=Protopterus annectens TaxID=7888 RepID=UPI001CF976ED|nr:RAD9, HUS1, RAD1-interacting nuclear orphan protein 1 [Protopterus annectens]XP_043943539.1 RAD9, HUS1, RAD1-interacting nuclear orphan protein 1 [Protopterus annectens]